VASGKIYLSVKKSLTLPVVLDDGTKVITGSKLTYKSTNKKVAKVNSKGKITALKAGSTKITVTAANGKKLTVKVTVVKKPVKLKSFSISGAKKNAITLKAGKTKDLKLQLLPTKATNLKVSFKSSKPKVATIDKAGRIKALAKGKATITVKAASKTVKVKLTVTS
jgi:uncharacterized protein YjdB